MHILYDEPKRLKVLEERGLDLAALTDNFFEGAIVAAAKNDRLRAIGSFEGKLVTVRPASQSGRRLL